jgi:FkbM family methyltransferase
MVQTFLGSEILARVLDSIAPVRILDIGARGKPTRDLLPMAWATELVGFEPDEQECQRLNDEFAGTTALPYRKVKVYPIALGPDGTTQTLYLTKHRGASTLLKPLPAQGDYFSTPEYVTVEATQPVKAVGLDRFIREAELAPVDYIKIDVEGYELEVFKSGRQLLSDSVLAIRTEVAFALVREDQPTYGDVECFLRQYGFIPMEFQQLNYWRPLTRTRYPDHDSGKIPFSREQLAHGDMVFFKNPAVFPQLSSLEAIRMAFLLLNFGFVDHAYRLLICPSHCKFLAEEFNCGVERELSIVSRHLEFRYRLARLPWGIRSLVRHSANLLRRATAFNPNRCDIAVKPDAEARRDSSSLQH